MDLRAASFAHSTAVSCIGVAVAGPCFYVETNLMFFYGRIMFCVKEILFVNKKISFLNITYISISIYCLYQELYLHIIRKLIAQLIK